MTYAQYSGSAVSYIGEYLDPDGTLAKSPITESEARELWHQLEEVFVEDGGTGIEEDDFVEAVREMQESNGFPAWQPT